MLFQRRAVTSLRLMSLDVPQLVLPGQETILNCVFDLEGETLYSMKWYRDDMEFFRYIPSDKPPNMFFPLKGLALDMSRSSNVTMYITDVDVTTSGTFKCEISADAPSFQTVSAEKMMTVEALTDHTSTTIALRIIPYYLLLLLLHVIL